MLSVPSFAQRADVNAVTSADDAFGFSSAGETIGLYDSGNVRGFSPSRAGNVRIEGLYFDWQARFTDDALNATRVRVGLSALDFPFASPSGIADYQLRHADADLLSGSVSVGPFGARAFNATWASRAAARGVALLLSAGGLDDKSAAGASGKDESVGVVADVQVAEHARLTVFANYQEYAQSQSDPTFYSSGASLPAPFERGVRLSQPWVRENGANENAGALWRADASGGWTVSGGLFYSRWLPWQSFDTIITDADRSERTDATVYASADADNHSFSGDLRLQHDWQWIGSQQQDTFSLRGRALQRRYGGEQEIALGAIDPDAPTSVDRPFLAYGLQDRASGRWHHLSRARAGGRLDSLARPTSQRGEHRHAMESRNRWTSSIPSRRHRQPVRRIQPERGPVGWIAIQRAAQLFAIGNSGVLRMGKVTGTLFQESILTIRHVRQVDPS